MLVCFEGLEAGIGFDTSTHMFSHADPQPDQRRWAAFFTCKLEDSPQTVACQQKQQFVFLKLEE